MRARASLRIGILSSLAVAGCASHGAHETGAPDAKSVLRGTVTYRERMALPPDAVVDVWLTDVSPLTASVPVIAEASVAPAGRQVPLPFELPYAASQIDPNHAYGLKATIRSAGETLFATATPYPVITQGNPTQVDLVLVRSAAASESTVKTLVGTAWRLEDLGGIGVLDRVQATLEFPETGKIAGHGSCNRYFGSVQVDGESIHFSQMGSTRMACVESVMNQEVKFLRALQHAERFTQTASTLLIYCKDLEKPLRFVPKQP